MKTTLKFALAVLAATFVLPPVASDIPKTLPL
jgi:hypothetical protein